MKKTNYIVEICIIPDCLKHNANTVHAFISKVMPLIKKEFPNLDLLYYFSNGAPSQYKNYKNFSNLYYHLHDYGIQAEWHFFATSHNKSPCDGIGGTVKRLVARASLQNTHILSARDMQSTN